MNKKRWLDIIKMVVPMIVVTAIPAVNPVIIGLVIHGIEVAEASGKPGSAKLVIAKEEISTVAQGVNAVKPGTIDVAQLNTVVEGVINTSVATANLINNIPVKK